jgi:hypothetical protein
MTIRKKKQKIKKNMTIMKRLTYKKDYRKKIKKSENNNNNNYYYYLNKIVIVDS